MQEIGPHLFPLIHRAEVRLTGARLLPPIPEPLQFRVADRYEMVGVVDVVTHVQLADPSLATNPIVTALKAKLGIGLPPEFEVIVDYKGMRRPPVPGAGGKNSLWTQYEWQLQTYGELRRVQPDALSVVAGVLLYVNELHPTRSDLELLKDEIANGTTDVPPAPGSPTDVALKQWKTRDKVLPPLPFDYRLARALRVVPITAASIASALQSFDGVVRDIETCLGQRSARLARSPGLDQELERRTDLRRVRFTHVLPGLPGEVREEAQRHSAAAAGLPHRLNCGSSSISQA